MTKKEVLQSIDDLIKSIDKWTGKRVMASLEKDDNAYREAIFALEGLAIDAAQELTFLRDYIDENIKDEDVLEQKHMGSYKTTTEVYNGKSKSKIKV